MLNRYAIIYPAFSFGGDGLGDVSYLFITPFHKCRYEQICGYSLGHKPAFYETLQEAQQQFSHEDDLIRSIERQNAIIEFQVNDEGVINFTKIFEIKEFEKLLKPITRNQDTFFKPVDVPVWNKRDISDDDLSAKALAEFNKYYEKSVMRNRTKQDHKL